MTTHDDDFSKRIAGHVAQQIQIGKKKKHDQELAKKGGKKFELKGTNAIIAGVLAVVVVLGAIVHGVGSSRPPGSIILQNLKETAVNDRPMLTGKVVNGTGSTVREKAWVITYLDGQNKKVVDVELVVRNIKSAETREWTLDIPGWKEGLRRAVRPKGE